MHKQCRDKDALQQGSKDPVERPDKPGTKPDMKVCIQEGREVGEHLVQGGG